MVLPGIYIFIALIILLLFRGYLLVASYRRFLYLEVIKRFFFGYGKLKQKVFLRIRSHLTTKPKYLFGLKCAISKPPMLNAVFNRDFINKIFLHQMVHSRIDPKTSELVLLVAGRYLHCASLHPHMVEL